MEESWLSRSGPMVVGAFLRLQERFKSAREAIFGVLRALRTRFWASWELQEGIFGVLRALWTRFWASWALQEGIFVRFRCCEKLK